LSNTENPAARTRLGESVQINHFHIYVRDLPAAIDWFQRVCEARMTYRGERMASLALGPMQVLLDEDAQDAKVTIGFSSEDCDADFRTAVDRGAEVAEPPTDRPWGVRAAYLRGPGAVTVELEQPLRK
jgi:predicted enzyme related to lactoylglutathione lyase